ncbi:MAG: trigger factor [Desulfonatronovibrio sp. MSAO_Bac4]|nr:MAG: trigger factor [Desulfonatronovibrio sp. MSAO_Bac4]
MDYQVEDISPVKKEIKIEVPAEEVNAALAATTALYRKDVDIKGFRKGKVPSSVIEGKFKKQITNEATTELVNLHINQVLSEIKANPLSRIDVDAGQLERGEDFKYSINFEVAPEFELPEYTGIKIEEEEVEVNPDEVQLVIDRIRNNLAELVLVEEERTPVDGDVVVIDFEAFKDDKPVEGVKADNFQMTLGEGNALAAFEDLVKKLNPGSTDEAEITLPDDFLNKELAGQNVLMKVTLHSIKEKKLPEVDDELAQKAGGFESVDKLKEVIEKSYIGSRKQLNKSVAQKKALDELKEKVDYELPPSMVQGQIEQKIAELKNSVEKKGKSFDSIGKTHEELQEEFRSQAEDMVKSQLFLLAIAQKEEITVEQQEMDAYIRNLAQSNNQDYEKVKSFYEENNLMFALRDSLLADKAMEFIYEKAEVTMTPAAPQESETSKDDK